MASTFVIQEMRATGGPPIENPDGELFEWTAKRRNIPKKPWDLPLEMRKVRTDYSGSKEASVQVLGPKRGPSTLEGRWDDRFNYPGYAKDEFDRMNAVVERGNPVRVGVDGLVYICLIESVTPRYLRRDYIEYTIVLDNYGEPTDSAKASPKTMSSPLQDLDDMSFVTQAALDTHAGAPALQFIAGLDKSIGGSLSTLSAHMDDLAAAIDTRQSVLKPITEFRKLATMMRIVQGDAANILASLAGVRSDVEMGVQTGKAVLDFECWSRGLRSQMRLLTGKASQAADGMDERASAKAVGYYRPRQGESLYRISSQVYGTPFAWKLIYERNGLQSLQLTGDELLIIPERSAG